MANLVFLDDCGFELAAFFDELTIAGHNFELFATTDEFIDYVCTGARIDIFVIDLILPDFKIRFEGKNIDTNRGMEAGLHVIKILRACGYSQPIVVLSQRVEDGAIEATLKQEVGTDNIAFVNKNRCPTVKFLKMIDETFDKGKIENSEKWGFLNIFGESLEIKPSIYGVTFDVKAAFQKLLGK